MDGEGLVQFRLRRPEFQNETGGQMNGDAKSLAEATRCLRELAK